MKKKVIFFIFVLFSVVNCFSKPKYYRTSDGYSGYVRMFYRGMNGECTMRI